MTHDFKKGDRVRYNSIGCQDNLCIVEGVTSDMLHLRFIHSEKHTGYVWIEVDCVRYDKEYLRELKINAIIEDKPKLSIFKKNNEI